MHVTTHETSQKIKDAGFPQPPFSVGQIWYNQSGIKYLITGGEGLLVFVKRIDAENWSRPLPIFNWEGWSYAASATELLPDNYHLMTQAKKWYCRLPHFDGKEFQDYYPIFYHENPAEAAAFAFLFTNNK